MKIGSGPVSQNLGRRRLPLRLPLLPVTERTVVRALGGAATGTIRWAMSAQGPGPRPAWNPVEDEATAS